MGIDINNVLKEVQGKIAPLWSLENFVAVNPYMGSANNTFEKTANYYKKLNGSNLTMPLSFYLKAIEENEILNEDLVKALEKSGLETVTPQEFIQKVESTHKKGLQKSVSVQLVVDCSASLTGKRCSAVMTDCITSWATNYYDKGIASWNSTLQNESNFVSWKKDALLDRTPKIHGLKQFHTTIKELPDDTLESIETCLEKLSIEEEILVPYLHALLLRIQGWSAYNSGLDWDANLYGGKKTNLQEFLAILLAWEVAFLNSLEGLDISDLWKRIQRQNAAVLFELNEDESVYQRIILQNAFDFACQRKLVAKINNNGGRISQQQVRPTVQAIFCIDVRSEVYRRNMEMLSPAIETLGFAGFFAFPINYVPIGHSRGQHQCPALIPTGATVKEVLSDDKKHQKAMKSRKNRFHLFSSWKKFRHGAVSCFGFVSPMGITFLPKLFLDGFGITRPVAHPKGSFLSRRNANNKSVSLATDSQNNQDFGLELSQQIKLAKNALSAMSLTNNFAKLVMITGHGSSSTNNPHATGYDCGACGGNSGEANAKVAAEVLNNSEVRFGLAKEGIKIPADTYFIAAEHDTTTDEVKLFKTELVPDPLKQELAQLKKWLMVAGHATRTERALRLNVNGKSLDRKVIARSKDWSQVRHEWGLAGCNTFVVAPRERTKDANLEGKSFLHSYDWKADKGFNVLELIMTAPMVVTNWINMQYFASTVDNKNFGAGNKTLHNITGGIGVLEGSSGDLRVGLPWQAVHDGENYQHLPQRLNVVIEAPIEAINDILEKHQNVKDLCDNKWIFLMVMNEEGTISHSYEKDLRWETLEPESVREKVFA
ncbi:MAG: YbcC family protein [Bacteroidota bacterium]